MLNAKNIKSLMDKEGEYHSLNMVFMSILKMRFILLIIIFLLIGCYEEDDPIYQEEKVVVVTSPSSIIVINNKTPDPYRHSTTHPSSQFKKLNLDSSLAHGDGISIVKFVGKVVHISKKGTIEPIPNVKFFRINDSMLLQEKKREELLFSTDTNGNFNADIYIFSASGCRKGSFKWESKYVGQDFDQISEEDAYEDFMEKHRKANKEGEWVTYQSGTAIISVETKGYKTRHVNIRYEQPSTLIVLENK